MVDELADDNRVDVVRQEPQHEDDVLLQVFNGKLFECFIDLFVILDVVEYLDMLGHVPVAMSPQNAVGQEPDQVDGGQYGQNHEPEPEYHVHLLSEDVDSEHALHGVVVVVA